MRSEIILLCSGQMSRRRNLAQNYDIIQKILLEDIPSGSETKFSDDFTPKNNRNSARRLDEVRISVAESPEALSLPPGSSVLSRAKVMLQPPVSRRLALAVREKDAAHFVCGL